MSKPSIQWLHSPLAIVGMACRLPGADGLEQFWQLLVNGGYAIERMPDSKLDRDLYFDPNKGKRCKTYSQIGGFVRERGLDWALLNIPPNQASDWDQCHLALCEVAARAFVDAGYDPKNPPNRNVGVFVGHSGGTTLGGDLAYRTLVQDYIELLAEMPELQEQGSGELLQQLQQQLCQHRPQRRPEGKPFVDAGFASGLISHNFGLKGPHMSIDAACASSLVALSLGAMSLAAGHTDMAIIGGASYNKSDSLVLFSAAQSCSAEMSRPFDQGADGLISSEGYVAILIKPLDKALQAGDRVHAVIRGIGYSSDGRGRSLWAPRHEGQAAAVARAYPEDIDPSSVQMIEAHATSTQVGDATEMEALTSFYAPKLAAGQRIAVGSVKSNIGHTLETAGLAGLVKSVLAIQHGQIPPSINVSTLNQTIPWDKLPFYVPQTAQAWPQIADGQPRRAAVNAFGIGGLNVHVVVDQAPSAATIPIAANSNQLGCSSLPKLSDQSQPIAVIGRGIVVPGANNLAEYQACLSRRPTNLYQTTNHVSFEYDWRKHKVPPKQVAQANPLQFMLLEAAEQALNESGLLNNDSFKRSTTAVVVGSIFGGDFGNALYAGLRLPEFRHRLRSLLALGGVASTQIKVILDRFEDKFLQQYPALLDETGSFTSSTLASRIAKTFNLMGGAMAIDAGDVSGLAALRSACWLLQSGSVDSVLCAAAQRALDRAALENLELCGRLKSAANANQGYTIGEGVALVVLKRLADAKRDGDKIIATVDGVHLGFDKSSLTRSIQSASAECQMEPDAQIIGKLGVESLDQQVLDGLNNTQSNLRLTRAANLESTGHLQGAQGLVDIINGTLDNSHQTQWIVGHTLSGQSALARLSMTQPQFPSATSRPQSQPIPTKTTTARTLSTEPREFSMGFESYNELFKNAGLEVRFWSADSMDDLRGLPARAGWSGSIIPAGDGRFAAAIVAPIGQSATKAKKFSSLLGQAQAMDQLIDQGIWWLDRSNAYPPRIAFAFSGQGSQYTCMLQALVKQFAPAREIMRLADEVLGRIDGVSFADLAWSPENQLGENVWQTQASLLVANSILSGVVQGLDIQPEFVFGHSYGEIPALLAAGAIDLQTAVVLTWHRCQSVTKYAPTGCSMLSVQADATSVAAAIASSHLPLTISHINAPLQTVVGGKHAHIAQLAAMLDDSEITSRILPVPTAFHTPALTAAVAPFRKALEQLPIQPPRLPFLSSVNNRFMADPDLIRDGLAEQLVTPLRFVELMEKVATCGVTHLIEIGPQRVLTRLSRATETGIQVFASDFGPQGENSPSALMPIALIAAFAQLTAPSRALAAKPIAHHAATGPTTTNLQLDAAKKMTLGTGHVKSFDATAARRNRLRAASSQNRPQPPGPAYEFASRSLPVSVPTIPTVGPSLRDPVSKGTAIEPSFAQPTNANFGVAKDSASTLASPSASEVQQILIDFVVEQTGYPPEIVELDADLEADLGIDSIKKAQLLGELRELFPQAVAGLRSGEGRGDARAQGNRLAQLRTLRDFVQLLAAPIQTTTASSSSTQTPSIHATTTPAAIPTAASNPLDATQLKTAEVAISATNASREPKPANTTENVPATVVTAALQRSSSTEVFRNQPTHSRKNLEQFVIDFVVEQTGYPAEIVELDADLEADLGIDSIKKAQLLGELRETFALKLNNSSESANNQPNRSKSNLDQLRTLNQILDMLAAHLGTDESRLPDNPSPTTAPTNSTSQDASAHAFQADPQSISTVDAESFAGSAIVNRSQNNAGSQEVAGIAPVAELPQQIGIPVYHANHRNGFGIAVRYNLRSLPARRSPATPAMLQICSDRIKRADELAEYAEVNSETLLAFDHELVAQSQWRVLDPETEICHSDLHFLLELELPNWLAEGSCYPLGMRSDENGNVLLITPGAITPLVIIDRKNNLLAASATNLDSKWRLARSLGSLINQDATEIQRVVRSQELAGDWWILLADTQRGVVDHLQMRKRIFSHASCEMNRWSGDATFSSTACSKIGFDQQSQTWTVVSRNSRLSRATQLDSDVANPTRMSLASLQSIEAGSTIELTETSFFSAFQSPEPVPENATTATVDLDISRTRDASGTSAMASEEQADAASNLDSNSHVAQRYVLRLSPAPQLEVPGRQPTWSGSAVVVGNNPIANQLEARLRACGVEVVRMTADGHSDTQLADQFAVLAQNISMPHLFITSPCDADAQITLNSAAWKQRRSAGLMNIFWLCQRWLQHLIEANLTDDASLIAVSSLGGDFGINGHIHSAEGGGINGLLKSILIECWMHGYRSLPIKTIDIDPQQSPAEVVNSIWRELAIPSYDNEIAYKNSLRHILKAIPRPCQNNGASRQARITRGGNWIFTGGARGITALVAERLALRYELTLHLLGTAPAPSIDPSWRDLDSEGLRLLKLQVMTEARKLGKNPVKHWQDTEKQLEIDATLRRLHALGIQASYHSCDVADRQQVEETLNRVRRASGPIHGVVHGAGVGRDARFDRKQPEKVQQCISAKVDGAMSLMEATWNDPLEAFVGFGSISGRFGANGHTDYSLANEMLCKQIDWLKGQRPQVRAIGFHWHAWGDVGMATKPETKLALEMIHMQFMPAEEGIGHLIAELECDSNESEVLITDDRYYRAFYPAETLVEAKSHESGLIETPLLATHTATDSSSRGWVVKVDPVKDPFLAEHLLDGKPLLPFVVAAEMLRQAGSLALQSSSIILRDITAHGAIRFFSEGQQELTLIAHETASGQSKIELHSDFVSRKGVVVDRNRLNFSASAATLNSTKPLRGSVQLTIPDPVTWQAVSYPPADAEFYVGWPLQKLRKVALTEEGLLGKISAPALIELAGVTRSTSGWSIPSAALDACLFAVGILAWQRIAPGSALPVRMGELRLGRLPRPGEALTVHAVMNEAREGTASFDFSLYGVDGALIVDVADYEVAWLSRTAAESDRSAESKRG